MTHRSLSAIRVYPRYTFHSTRCSAPHVPLLVQACQSHSEAFIVNHGVPHQIRGRRSVISSLTSYILLYHNSSLPLYTLYSLFTFNVQGSTITLQSTSDKCYRSKTLCFLVFHTQVRNLASHDPARLPFFLCGANHLDAAAPL